MPLSYKRCIIIIEFRKREFMKSVPAKSILQNMKYGNQWFGNDFNMNLYRGCCHGCIYCDSRSECYQIKNFDTVCVKENAIAILERELMYKSRKGVVGIGAMSDSYNPFEKEELVTRQALTLLARYGFGVSLETKSDLVIRDIDLFQQITEQSSCIIKMTITTADDQLCRIIEPNVSVSSKRFAAIKQMSDAGIFTGILFNPLLPYLCDSEENIKEVVRLSAEAGAKFIHTYFGVTLRQNQRDYYYAKLDEHFPGLKMKYIQQYGNKYNCSSPDIKKLRNVFVKECNTYGLLYRMSDIIHAYKKPKDEQLTLF